MALPLAVAAIVYGLVLRDAPRPGTGAADVEELVAAYRRAHDRKDPARLHDLELTLLAEPRVNPTDAQVRGALQGLVELTLEGVRLEPMP
jgi:hypothetical protein